MPTDDLDAVVDELATEDQALPARVAAVLERRDLLRQLAALRREQGLTQVELAERMGTSQAQITRLEAGADTRLSTVERYAAALGMKVTWHLEPAPTPKTSCKKTPSKVAQRTLTTTGQAIQLTIST